MAESIILYNDRVATGHYLMGLKLKSGSIKPGQFVMLKVTPGVEPLLRRPFSVYNVSGAAPTVKAGGAWGRRGDSIELLYKVVGKGTSIMSTLKPGETLDVMGPLGNSFPKPRSGKRLIMVAGGIGIAPFRLMAGGGAGRAGASGPLLLYGARSKSEASMARPLKRAGLKVKLSTEDGSIGRRGFVTELLKEELKEGDLIYSCGPTAMLKAVAKVAEEYGAECFVSLENSMACGVGACLGCAVRVEPCIGNKNKGALRMVCSDGPVFDAYDIDWENL